MSADQVFLRVTGGGGIIEHSPTDNPGTDIAISGNSIILQATTTIGTQANPVQVAKLAGGTFTAPSVFVTATTDVTLGEVQANGMGVRVVSPGSILDGNGASANLVLVGAATTESRLIAAGTIGTAAAPLDVNINQGRLLVQAGAVGSDGASASLRGTLAPDNTYSLITNPPGIATFNGTVIFQPPPAAPAPQVPAQALLAEVAVSAALKVADVAQQSRTDTTAASAAAGTASAVNLVALITNRATDCGVQFVDATSGQASAAPSVGTGSASSGPRESARSDGGSRDERGAPEDRSPKPERASTEDRGRKEDRGSQEDRGTKEDRASKDDTGSKKNSESRDDRGGPEKGSREERRSNEDRSEENVADSERSKDGERERSPEEDARLRLAQKKKGDTGSRTASVADETPAAQPTGRQDGGAERNATAPADAAPGRVQEPRTTGSSTPGGDTGTPVTQDRSGTQGDDTSDADGVRVLSPGDTKRPDETPGREPAILAEAPSTEPAPAPTGGAGMPVESSGAPDSGADTAAEPRGDQPGALSPAEVTLRAGTPEVAPETGVQPPPTGVDEPAALPPAGPSPEGDAATDTMPDTQPPPAGGTPGAGAPPSEQRIEASNASKRGPQPPQEQPVPGGPDNPVQQPTVTTPQNRERTAKKVEPEAGRSTVQRAPARGSRDRDIADADDVDEIDTGRHQISAALLRGSIPAAGIVIITPVRPAPGAAPAVDRIQPGAPARGAPASAIGATIGDTAARASGATGGGERMRAGASLPTAREARPNVRPTIAGPARRELGGRAGLTGRAGGPS